MRSLTTYNEKMTYNSNYSLPNTSHAKTTGLAMYYKDYLLKKVFGLYDIVIPDTWDIDYFRYTLFCTGHITTFNEGDTYGVIPQHSSLHGFNVFYRPTKAIVANPNIKGTRELTINEDCTVIKLTPNYKGIWDIIDVYGDLMALCAAGVSTNILNSRLAYVFAAKSKTAAESYKKMFDKIESGDAAVVVDRNLFNDDGSPAWQTFTQNLAQNFIAPQILDCMAAIEKKFDETVGIPSVNEEKKERLITAEAEANNIDTRILADVIYESLLEGITRHNRMFPDYPINISYKYDLGGAIYEQADYTLPDRIGEP